MIRGPFCVVKSHFITQMYAMCSTSLPLHELLSLPRRLAQALWGGPLLPFAI